MTSEPTCIRIVATCICGRARHDLSCSEPVHNRCPTFYPLMNADTNNVGLTVPGHSTGPSPPVEFEWCVVSVGRSGGRSERVMAGVVADRRGQLLKQLVLSVDVPELTAKFERPRERQPGRKADDL